MECSVADQSSGPLVVGFSPSLGWGAALLASRMVSWLSVSAARSLYWSAALVVRRRLGL